MTQPVNEPTTQRSIAYGAWRTNQLERRPTPSSEGGVMDHAYLFYDNFDTIAGDGNFVTITGYSDACDGDTIEANPTAGGFIPSTSGIYLIYAKTYWANSFAGGKAATIQRSGMSAQQDGLYSETWSSEQNTDLGVDMVTATELIFCHSNPASPAIACAVAQNSGSPEDLASVDFSIVRLAPWVQYCT